MKTSEVIANAEMRKCDACGAVLEYLDETLCHRCAAELEAI